MEVLNKNNGEEQKSVNVYIYGLLQFRVAGGDGVSCAPSQKTRNLSNTRMNEREPLWLNDAPTYMVNSYR